MNQKDKLMENTILALQGKLNEDNDINKYYRDFGSKVRQITQRLIKDPDVKMTRKRNLITITIAQSDCIDRVDCFKYIQKIAPVPKIGNIEYGDDPIKGDGYIIPTNEAGEQAVDYVNNKYCPAQKKYMVSNNNSCIEKIKKYYKDNNIKIKDFIDNGLSLSEWYSGDFLNAAEAAIIVRVIKEIRVRHYSLIWYQHTYTVIIDIEDNVDLDLDNNDKYRVSYNPNLGEYTVRDRKTGRVYFATYNAGEAYAELNNLNNGGSRGPELHKQGMIF